MPFCWMCVIARSEKSEARWVGIKPHPDLKLYNKKQVFEGTDLSASD